MNKHSFFSYSSRKVLSVCKLILIVTAFLSTTSFAQEQTPVDTSISSIVRPLTTTLGSAQDIEYQVYVYVSPRELGASGVVLTADLPEGVTFSLVRIDNFGDCSYADNRVTCNMNYPTPKGRVIDYRTLIRIFAKPTRTGSITFTAQIKANEPDPNLSNNTTSKTVNVLRPKTRVRFF
jgi:hypothetical protein